MGAAAGSSRISKSTVEAAAAALRSRDPRCGVEPQARDRLVAHLVLLHLAGDGHRKLVDDDDVARDLVVSELAVAELADRVGVEARDAFAQNDPRAQLLAVMLVRDAYHLHVRNRWVGVEELLDLARVDVLAAADDHVLAAPD